MPCPDLPGRRCRINVEATHGGTVADMNRKGKKICAKNGFLHSIPEQKDGFFFNCKVTTFLTGDKKSIKPSICIQILATK